MANPYIGRPPFTFWNSAVSSVDDDLFDPVVEASFKIGKDDRIATAGSCFAQHISSHLSSSGYTYYVTERFDETRYGKDENFGVFPARFGNVYTTRQLLQLIARAYGLFTPVDDHWIGKNGGYIDPFRPRIQTDGFATLEELRADRERHLSAVRDMFENCDVFVFTLGLTEYWRSRIDRAAFPMAPGIFSDTAENYEFHNATVLEIVDELRRFVEFFRMVNPTARIVFTVSPVALIATYEDRHVLVSTTASKSKLRAAVDEICASVDTAHYFPSYEIILGQHARGRFLADDLREVRPEGVAYVMERFARHYLGEGAPSAPPVAAAPAPAPSAPVSEQAVEKQEALARIVCDEEAIVAFQKS